LSSTAIHSIDTERPLARSQYVKQEEVTTLPDGTKKAIAIRQITERASSRIGRMAFELALKRGQEREINPSASFWKVSTSRLSMSGRVTRLIRKPIL
jgi:hypothetical protein